MNHSMIQLELHKVSKFIKIPFRLSFQFLSCNFISPPQMWKQKLKRRKNRKSLKVCIFLGKHQKRLYSNIAKNIKINKDLQLIKKDLNRLDRSDVSVVHGELSKVDAVLAAPHLEVVKVLDCGFFRGQHKHYIFTPHLSYDHLHFRMSSEIHILD